MKKGFTLIELLVVIVIIGILATLATVALSSARMKARDARRVSDVKQIMTALEMYYNDKGGYPTGVASGSPLALGTGTMTSIVGDNTYMSKVPMNAAPAADGTCPGTATYTYTPTYPANSIGSTYTIVYCLGGTTGSIAAGPNTASPAGISQ